VELLLALGASRYEATVELVQRAVRLALLPTLNAMSVVGIVSIPGMMTGARSSPLSLVAACQRPRGHGTTRRLSSCGLCCPGRRKGASDEPCACMLHAGQILGGSDPAVAARYQIVIYYLASTLRSSSLVAALEQPCGARSRIHSAAAAAVAIRRMCRCRHRDSGVWHGPLSFRWAPRPV
jgi:hypothetical protein